MQPKNTYCKKLQTTQSIQGQCTVQCTMTTFNIHLMNCQEVIHKYMTTSVMDVMDVIHVVHEICRDDEIRAVLTHLIRDDSVLDLPMNVKIPLECVLGNDGLLEGILRYMR